ncbi:MAG: universal stress protein [Nitrospirae bacterium]|nr:universal stress protein [Nitrospirota bacterium]
MKGYRKILIAVNGSHEVLRQGLRLAHDEKCWVTVIKVIPSYEGDLNLTAVKNIEDALNSGMQRAVNDMKDIAKSERAMIKTRIEEGEIHRKILEAAKEEDCDIIIMGANRKKRFIGRLFGDNVVEKVVNNAPCPVLVVKA